MPELEFVFNFTIFLWFYCYTLFFSYKTLTKDSDVTAALGLCLEKMTREDLDATKDALHSILQGISCRVWFFLL